MTTRRNTYLEGKKHRGAIERLSPICFRAPRCGAIMSGHKKRSFKKPIDSLLTLLLSEAVMKALPIVFGSILLAVCEQSSANLRLETRPEVALTPDAAQRSGWRMRSVDPTFLRSREVSHLHPAIFAREYAEFGVLSNHSDRSR